MNAGSLRLYCWQSGAVYNFAVDLLGGIFLLWIHAQRRKGNHWLNGRGIYMLGVITHQLFRVVRIGTVFKFSENDICVVDEVVTAEDQQRMGCLLKRSI